MAKRRQRRAGVEQATEAVGYVRVSTNEQADTGLSLEAQRARIEAQATANGWRLVAVYEDAGLSAKTLERAGLRAAFDALRPGRVLLAVRLDRLTRSVPDLYSLDAEVSAQGAEWATVAERIDTSTATGRMMRTLLATLAEWEREVIAERTSAALKAKRARGERLGTTPLGFQTVRDADGAARLVVDEAEQETVALARRLRAEGWTYQKIADRLAAEGCPTKRGGAWNASRVRKIVLPRLADGLTAR